MYYMYIPTVCRDVLHNIIKYYFKKSKSKTKTKEKEMLNWIRVMQFNLLSNYTSEKRTQILLLIQQMLIKTDTVTML